MAAPNIAIQIEPSESGKAVYLPLAATTATGKTMVKLVLRLRLENKGSGTVKVKAIRFSFPGSSQPAMDMQGVNMDGGLDLDAGETATWSNGMVDLDPDPDVKNIINNSVYLTGAAPSQVKVEVTCKDFSEPATVTLSLAAHQSPVAGEAYRFPYAAGELRDDEYYQTSAVHWANGGAGGTQIFAHDIGVVGWDSKAKKWSGLLPGGDRLKNEDYRIWNKPIRAMADGTVEAWSDGMEDNTLSADEDGNLQFPVPTPSPVGGNTLTVRHGTELVTYCHLRKGSMPEELKKKGTPVSEGQLLGRAGNTGNSTNPHTHIQSVRASDSALRPLPFRDASVIEFGKLSPPSADGPWFRLQGHGIPKDAVAIWPASTSPGFPVPMVGISMEGDWANSYFIRPDLPSFQKTAQDLFDQKGRRLIRATTFLEKGVRRWVGISRAGDWANQWWVSPSLAHFQKTAQDLFDQKGLRLIYVSSFVEGGKRSWIGISRGGDWANRLIIQDDLASFSKEAQHLFDDQGLRLIHVMTWLEGGKRRWLGISRAGSWANKWWISPDLGHFSTRAQQLFDNEGKRLVHVTTYQEGSKRRWVGISRSGTWANRWFHRSDLDSFGLEAQRLFDDKHLRLVHVEPLE
ncbi:M23 family metallopeptidase [Archangium lipolyticum]|uniref:M23 family metallopeptidase n=1 Tax=Archangium lipolyticum TaxID=2970465 RepID=UPI00214A54B0|nr:M23 family metallopeptidase [Archangium lipolyticum]